MPRRMVALALIGAAAGTPLAAVAVGWDWYLEGPASILLGVAGGYAAGAWLSRWVAAAAVLVTTTALVAANQVHGVSYHWLDDSVFYLLAVGGPAVVGATVTARARQVRRLERLQDELAEQERADVAAARLDEKNRLHHEVHARLGERIAAIAVRAEGARRSEDDTALRAIETEGRGVLDQLRDALGSMRPEPPDTADAADAADAADGHGPAAFGQPVGPRPRPSASDVALAVAVGAVLAIETAVIAHARGPAPANVLVAFLTAAPLVFRRGWPVAAGAGCLVGGSVMSLWLTPLTTTVTGLALLAVIFYSIGAWGRPRWWVGGWALAAAGTAGLGLASGPETDSDGADLWIVLICTVGVAALGRVAAGWHARARRTSALVDQLERGRGAAVRLARAREREVLASELHDTVAHAMTVVCLHAGAGRRLPDEVLESLQTITLTVEASLAELREGIDAFESVEHPLEPSRVAAIGRRMGVDVTMAGERVSGKAANLGYRLVREAIVNIARHAPGASATVTVERAGGVVSIAITDSGGTGATTHPGTGTGLSGLARVVDTSGGTMAWGPAPHGGYRVAATIPEDGP